MEFEAHQMPHFFIYVDGAWLNLPKTRWRGRNLIGKRTTVGVPGQRGANITICAALSSEGLLLHRPVIGPYNTVYSASFYFSMSSIAGLRQWRKEGRWGALLLYGTMWHFTTPVQSPSGLQPILFSRQGSCCHTTPLKMFFSAWTWKVYNHNPHTHLSLLDAMNAGCEDTSAEDCQA